MIMAYLSRLNKREKLVFYAAAVFISIALIDRLIVGPIFSRMRLLDEKIKVQKELVKKNARIVSEKDRVLAAAKDYAVYSRKAQTSEEEVAFLLGEVEKMARKTSLYVVDMKPLGMEEDSISRKYSVDLNCESQMEQIMGFMYEVESSDRLLVVETFNISPKSKDSSIAKCNMRISNVIFL
ncbi:MAG: type 4a pilus biogenesis protein PilO [Candidatus Omnitrophota bacterium]